MKTLKDIDVLRKAELFTDTPEMVSDLQGLGLPVYARHMHQMHKYHKVLIAEIRKLRRQLKGKP